MSCRNIVVKGMKLKLPITRKKIISVTKDLLERNKILKGTNPKAPFRAGGFESKLYLEPVLT